MKSLNVHELHEQLRRGAVTVLDVREDEELAIARLPGALHIPLQELPQRLAEVPRDTPLAVLCHHGMRSAMATRWLMQQGHADVANIDGGIDAWSCLIDAGVPRY